MRKGFFECHVFSQQWAVRLTSTVLISILFGDLCSCDVYMQAQCGQTVRSIGERIYSQIGHQYQPNINCSVTLKGQYKGQKIFLRIEDIDIRGNADCSGDYLEVYGASTKPHLICNKGRGTINKVTSKGDYLRLVFNTDGLNNGRGFRAVYTALFPDKQCRDHEKYQCANGRCISSLLTCDTVNHCGDSSDERPIACQKKKEYRERYKRVGKTNVVIPELIFICIGSFLVLLFLFFCIPQFITHILYMNTKWSQRKQLKEVVGSTASGSHRPSIASLRAHPSNSAFIPMINLMTMGELLKDPTNTLSMIRNASSRGNDDRDQVIANAVSSGQKVHVGRFMVEKSTVSDTIDEEDEYESDEYDQHAREAINETTWNDGNMSSWNWIERREAKISRNLETERLLDDSSESSIPGGDTICWEEKEALLKQRALSMTSSRPRAPSRPRAYSNLRSIPPDWGFRDDGSPGASQVVVRSRASTLPYKPNARISSFVPEWDFSSSASSLTEDVTGEIMVPFPKLSPAPVGPNSSNQVNKVGRFSVVKVCIPEEAQNVKSPGQEDISQPDLQESMNKSTTPAAAKIGRFTVQKAATNTNDPMTIVDGPLKGKSSDNNDLGPKRGRFTINKVEEPNQTGSIQEKSNKDLTRGRFSVQKIQEENNETTKLQVTDVSKSRFAVSKVDENERDTENNSTNTTKPSQPKPFGRFAVQKASSPDPQRKSHQHNAYQPVSRSVPLQRSGTGRFTVNKVQDQDPSLGDWDFSNGCEDETDDVSDEKAPMLSGADSNDEWAVGFLETEI